MWRMREGKPVFAHPQNQSGVDTVIAAGVDVMAHTVAGAPGYTPEQLARFKSQGIALIPTLSLFDDRGAAIPPWPPGWSMTGVNQLKAFSDNGGPVLFGTDVGFTTIYDTSLEYELMRRALSERQVLASLTTNPARYFKAVKKGRVEHGFDADSWSFWTATPWTTSATSPKSPPPSARAGSSIRDPDGASTGVAAAPDSAKTPSPGPFAAADTCRLRRPVRFVPNGPFNHLAVFESPGAGRCPAPATAAPAKPIGWRE